MIGSPMVDPLVSVDSRTIGPPGLMELDWAVDMPSETGETLSRQETICPLAPRLSACPSPYQITR